jgi:chromosome segregation ATPase
LDVNKLQLLTGEERFLTIDKSSALGSELVAFALKMEERKDEVLTLKEEIVTLGMQKSDLAAQIETLEMQKSNLAAQIETLEMQKSNLAAQLDTLHEQNRLLQQDQLLQHTVLIEQLIASKRSLLHQTRSLLQ